MTSAAVLTAVGFFLYLIAGGAWQTGAIILWAVAAIQFAVGWRQAS